MTRTVALGLALVAGGLVSAACVQSVGRATPTPQAPAPTATSLPGAATPAAAPQPTRVPSATAGAAPSPVPMATATSRPAIALQTPTAAPGATASPRPAATAPPAPAATPTAQAVPVSTIARFGLFLEIDGLGEENVVRGDFIVARGKTSPAAILSINGVIIPVDSEGNFSVQLALEPGPNIIEVVASDLEGNEVSKIIAVVALPEGVKS